MATRTAAARRRAAKSSYDVFLAACPTRQLLGTLGNKWVGLILMALAERPQRYNALAARIAGVSQKMLTQTLRTLERDGLLVRTVTAQVPVRVDYALTELGASLIPVVRAIKDWAETNMDDVLRARASYDTTDATDTTDTTDVADSAKVIG